jgi:pantoate kinase
MGARRRARRRRRSAAFAPGHVTTWFSPRLGAADPRARGSVGEGFVIDAGARAEASWEPDRARRIRVTAPGLPELPISQEVAERLFADRGGALTVRLHHELPVGCGLGMSAAGAAATALAVGQLVGTAPQRSLAVAHLAELFGGGGLGGVAAIGGGGVERRVRPGIPPWGRVDRRPWRAEVWIVLTDRPLPTPPLLASDRFLDRVDRASRSARGPLRVGPLLDRGEAFTDRLQLLPRTLARRMLAVRDAGAWCGQAMLGRTLWVVPRPSADPAAIEAILTGIRGTVVRVPIAARGARRLAGSAEPSRKGFNGPRLAAAP